MKRLCCISLLALSSCVVGPDYHQPKLAVPPAYKAAPGWVAAAPADNAPKGPWWVAFGDPTLNALEPQVALHNATLAADYDAFEQATEIVREARASYFPTIGITGTATRAHSGSGSGSGVSTISSSGSGAGSGAGSGTSTGVTTGSSASSGPRNSGTFEGNASWVPDIWGKIRRQVQQNTAAAQVSAADLANATLSAQAALAADYVDLRAADANIALYRQTAAAYQRSLQITQNQAAAGTAAPADVITARTQLEGAEAQLIDAGAARAQYEHAIALLIGQAPSGLSIPAGPQIALVPVAPPAVPATLLERRPDIAAAERSMAEQNAAIGVAVGAYYPDLTLSAMGGWAADPIGGLFSASNTLWSLGASATGTIFEGGYRSAAVGAASDAYQESADTYRGVVLAAFQNVENDLSNLQIYGAEAQVQAQAVADAQRAAQIALNEYQAGTVTYTSIVTAQVTLLQDQETALGLQQQRLQASIALYQDLGGGFTIAALPGASQLQPGLPFAP